MKTMEEKIRREGVVLPGNILKVGSFLNQQIDVAFLTECARKAEAALAEAKAPEEEVPPAEAGVSLPPAESAEPDSEDETSVENVGV